MKRITLDTVRAAYARMGYQPVRDEWHLEGDPREDGREPVYFACPQTTILELEGLISHDEEGPNIETTADDEWGAAYAQGFRDGWDGLDPRPAFLCAGYGLNGPTDYELGLADGRAAASEFIPETVEPESSELPTVSTVRLPVVTRPIDS